jgi:hypothetical protein
VAWCLVKHGDNFTLILPAGHQGPNYGGGGTPSIQRKFVLSTAICILKDYLLFYGINLSFIPVLYTFLILPEFLLSYDLISC